MLWFSTLSLVGVGHSYCFHHGVIGAFVATGTAEGCDAAGTGLFVSLLVGAGTRTGEIGDDVGWTVSISFEGASVCNISGVSVPGIFMREGIGVGVPVSDPVVGRLTGETVGVADIGRSKGVAVGLFVGISVTSAVRGIKVGEYVSPNDEVGASEGVGLVG